jgi:hypothetical protein
MGISTELFASVGCFGRWVLGVGCWALGVGRWVFGVGCAAGPPRGPTLKRALGLPLAACFAPPWPANLLAAAPNLAAAPHLAAAAPKGEGMRAPSPRPPPKHPAGSQRPPHKKIPRSGRKFLGVGCLILGVGRLRIWALGVYRGFWALGGTDHLLGVGCWALDAPGDGVGWFRRAPRGGSEVGAQVPQPASI